ncbi:hypothetical protein VE01_04529 [Pseudogymnoascus verrucosus]|uniref:DUF1275 domain protein n=1 Tax=Pseudogymnoascus verrucosus TaxID=342668 RepID=A0A1B8GNZ4_9PEZI|nr:uncharacterized protein VE01_04529 [Pseudogymnoascus verrucosus]OBT97565.1 hypothetical protein VE01_04529 [Pseudogymnoascus verrucosus]
MASTEPQQQPSLISATLPGETTPDVTDAEKQSPKARSSWLTELKRDVNLNHTDIPVIASCFSSGLCDSSAFNAWNTFVSMQTGNTIILALGASGQPVSQPYIWLKSLTAIVFFLIGCYFFAQSRRIHPHRRFTLAASFLVQAILIFVAAALVQRHVVPSPSGYHELDPGRVAFIELLPIGFLAFQSGGQIVTSRTLGINEVPTTVLTSLFCDLMSDPHMLARDNVKRNRRVASAVTLLLGGIIGGWLSRSSVGMSAALWLAGGVKVGIAVGWAVWRAKEEVPV